MKSELGFNGTDRMSKLAFQVGATDKEGKL